MSQRDRQHIQVLVVGASVAGCATAWMLADTGLSVTLVEKLSRESPFDYFGESLPPKCLLDLRRLDLHEAEELFGCRTYSVQSAWGSNTVTARSFAATVPGHGLHIDKERLVRLLRDRIEANGMKIHFGHRLCIERTNSDGSHLVSMSTSDTKIEAVARILVDASGRTRAVARQYTDILHFDRLIATASRGQAMACPPSNLSPSASFTEAVSNGWWYSASLHHGQRIAIRFSDNHEEITQRLRNRSQFWDELRQTRWTSKFFADADQESTIDIRSAATTSLRQFAGPGCVHRNSHGQSYFSSAPHLSADIQPRSLR